jgi:hypothetical protein
VAQDYLGATRHYYHPSNQGFEARIQTRVEAWRAQFNAARPAPAPPSPPDQTPPPPTSTP